MRAFLRSQYWQVFQRHAQWEIDAWKARTLSETAKEFDYNKGVYEGLCALVNLPHKILNLEERLNANRQV